MRLLALLSLILTCSQAIGQNCENIVALSKVVTSTVSDKSAFEQQAAAFCSDYSKKQKGDNATNIGASYGAISGSFGQSSSSMDEVASKVCSSANLSTASSDAYKNYVETISPNAYSAYQTCVSLTQSDMRFDVNLAAVLPSEFSIAIGYRALAQGDTTAIMAYSASAGVTCSWGNTASPTRTLKDKDTVLFKCSRTDQSKPGYVKVARMNGVGGELTIPWIAYSKEGVPITTLATMQKQLDQLNSQYVTASATISSLVSAPAIQVYRCPAGNTPGWNPGGPWGSYGCQGQLSTTSTCDNIEYPNHDTRPCAPIGKLRLY